jgi:aryl-alcohol dehydrogenase-like predicted oxidoreductase
MTDTQLGIGTAQFGGGYGIVENSIVPSINQAKNIINEAIDRGANFFDTAADYGNAEEVLGHCLPEKCAVRIVTKLPALPNDCLNVQNFVFESLQQSKKKLNGRTPDLLLIHQPGDAIGKNADALINTMLKIKSEGQIGGIGISLYDSNEISTFQHLEKIDCIQLPINVLDQRLMHSRDLLKLHDAGIEIMARSAFLQGLILSDPALLPKQLALLSPAITSVRQLANDYQIQILDVCLDYLKLNPYIDSVVVGVKRIDQLRNIATSWERPPIELDWNIFNVSKVELLDPRNWN